jgi:hypothetical protein
VTRVTLLVLAVEGVFALRYIHQSALARGGGTPAALGTLPDHWRET